VNLNALSGMQAAALVVDVVGHDIANMDTPDFHAQRVDQAAAAGGGVTTTVTTATDEGVDLAEQIGRLITGSIAYDANAAVVRTEDEVTRTLVDVRA